MELARRQSAASAVPPDAALKAMGRNNQRAQLGAAINTYLGLVGSGAPALYPAASVARLLGSLGTRYVATTRLLGGYTHQPASVSAPLRAAADVQRLLRAASWIGDPCATLSMGTVAVGRTPSSTGVLTVVHTQREFILDLDVRDWERARPGSRALLCACDDRSVCAACWTLVVLAVAVCRAWFTDVLGLGPMLVVASGGKGAHLLWGSRAARTLPHATRQQWLAQCTAPATAEAVAVAAAGTPLAHIREAALAAWAAHAPRLLADARGRLAQWLAALLPPRAAAHWTWPADAAARWPAWSAAAGPAEAARAVLHLAWPVPDPVLVKNRNHLAKVPFSVHTKRPTIALPLPADAVAAFDPAAHTPTVPQLAARDPAAVARVQAGAAALDAWLDACGYPRGID